MIREVTLIASVLVLAACGPSASESTDAPVLDAQTVTVALPEGDAAAGRKAFQDLRCTACHAVPSEPDMPAPVSAMPGPILDAEVARRDISYLLASILTPSHAISLNISDEVRGRLEGVLSPMGDFSQVMTVRQLVDVHAYIRSIR
jgi:hypothetical protein